MDAPAVWFERIGPGDAQQLATDVGPVPANVGAVLLLGPGPGLDARALAGELATRLCRIPRMRQRLQRVPPGCGRPVWVDAAAFDPLDHVRIARCPPPGDLDAALRAAVALVNEPLARSRPLWQAVVLTHLRRERMAVVLVLHHVLADGMGGLAVLANLVDGGSPMGDAAGSTPTRPPPPGRALLVDAARTRWAALRAAPRAAAALGPALTELGRHRPRRAPACSLNRPTGPRRHAVVLCVPLAQVKDLGHAHHATVNDVLLVAATRSLGTVLAARGEHPPELVVSVPVAARTGAAAAQLGNQVGVMPVAVPLGDPFATALAEVATTTAARRTTQRGASTALIAPAFRALAAVGLFGPMIARQRLVNTFLTNMRGPERPMTLGGAPIELIAPLTPTTGNVSACFTALSYAGTLTVVVTIDPDLLPEHELVLASLRRDLAGPGLGNAPNPASPSRPPPGSPA